MFTAPILSLTIAVLVAVTREGKMFLNFLRKLKRILLGRPSPAPGSTDLSPTASTPSASSEAETSSDPNTNTSDPNKLKSDFKFVDSSHHHPDFDVTKYPAPLFINKCTQGLTFLDKTHAIRKQQCEEKGIIYGGYHFFMCDKSPIQQANFYVEQHGPFKMPPIVDYETTTGQTDKDLVGSKDALYAHLCELERLTGKTPIIYLNYFFSLRVAKFDERFARFPAWFARYNSFLGPIPAPWTLETTFAWQFTDSGEFGGLKGGNDVNVYYAKSKVL